MSKLKILCGDWRDHLPTATTKVGGFDYTFLWPMDRGDVIGPYDVYLGELLEALGDSGDRVAVLCSDPRTLLDVTQFTDEAWGWPLRSWTVFEYAETGYTEHALVWQPNGNRKPLTNDDFHFHQLGSKRPAAIYDAVPAELVLYLLNRDTGEGEVVLDPRAGTGWTAAAAQQLGRDCVCIEADREYCTTIKDRVS